jgi:Ca-activated chloride channel family protein
LLRFEHTWFLATLVALPVLVFLFRHLLSWKKNTLRRIGDEPLIRQLIAGYSPRKFLIKFILVATAFTLTALGVANLQYPKEVEKINRQGIDVIIILDVSKSMLAADIKPNRLEKARQLISKLIDRLQNDRIGLVIFAGRAYLQMPLTTDHAAAKMYVNTASPESVPAQGTVIGESLTLTNNAFGKKEKKYKAAILITDGEDHDDGALAAAEDMKDNGVILHTIGLGSPEGTTIMDPETHESKRDASGNIVVSTLNEPALRELAKAGLGTYLKGTDTEVAVQHLYSQVNSMEQKSITDQSFISYRSFFEWFLAIALVLLVTDLFVSEKKRAAA